MCGLTAQSNDHEAPNLTVDTALGETNLTQELQILAMQIISQSQICYQIPDLSKDGLTGAFESLR